MSRNNIRERGVSLYLAFMIMTLLLGTALGVSGLLLGQIQSLRGVGQSSLALHAADSGIERILFVDSVAESCKEQFEGDEALYVLCVNGLLPSVLADASFPSSCKPSAYDKLACMSALVSLDTAGVPVFLANGASYRVEVVAPGSGQCPASSVYCSRSRGIFKTIQRALQISR